MYMRTGVQLGEDTRRAITLSGPAIFQQFRRFGCSAAAPQSTQLRLLFIKGEVDHRLEFPYLRISQSHFPPKMLLKRWSRPPTKAHPHRDLLKVQNILADTDPSEQTNTRVKLLIQVVNLLARLLQ